MIVAQHGKSGEAGNAVQTTARQAAQPRSRAGHTVLCNLCGLARLNHAVM